MNKKWREHRQSTISFKNQEIKVIFDSIEVHEISLQTCIKSRLPVLGEISYEKIDFGRKH